MLFSSWRDSLSWIVWGRASRHATSPWAFISSQLRSSAAIPPPVDTTCSSLSHRRSIRSASSFRKWGSPLAENISSTDMPAALAISSSVSTNRQPSLRATSRPTVVFPEPEKPVMNMFGFISF